MKKIFLLNIEIIFSLVIFITILIAHIPFYKVVILLLEFIVILEVVKMIADFVKKQKLRLRFMIDVFIIFLIRDVIIAITNPDTTHEKIYFLLLVIFVFFIFRIFTLIYSPTLIKRKGTIAK